MRRITAILVILMVTAMGTSLAMASGNKPSKAVRVVVDGKQLSLDKSPVIMNGRTLVPVRNVFENLGADVKWQPESSTVEVSGKNTVISMRIGYIAAKVNDALVKLDTRPVIINGSTMVPIRFVAELLNSDVKWDPVNYTVIIKSRGSAQGPSRGSYDRTYNAFSVVIDAGHGGWEPGAVYWGVKEKDLNLAISRRLEQLLKEEGIKTYMTRLGDSYVGLYSRSFVANSVKADLLVSVHNNAGHPATTGTMTLYYPGVSNYNGRLSARNFAFIVQNELVKQLGTRNLGVIERSNLAVLRTARMPAVIAEIGYMSNQGELNTIRTAEYQQRAAEALKNSIIKSFSEM
ncbi:MAG: N-acetylmuramoyl-L-alanine amidase [Clostridia bacterium]|nr:N-acetylmuramoyl-L-alanine amidase [Clostridia bacterium]